MIHVLPVTPAIPVIHAVLPVVIHVLPVIHVVLPVKGLRVIPVKHNVTRRLAGQLAGRVKRNVLHVRHAPQPNVKRGVILAIRVRPPVRRTLGSLVYRSVRSVRLSV